MGVDEENLHKYIITTMFDVLFFIYFFAVFLVSLHSD